MLVICDEYYKEIRELDEGWEAHICPGLRLYDAADIIENIENTESLTTIVTAVGRHDRHCPRDQNESGLEQVDDQLRDKNLTGIFVAVNIPPSLSPKEQTSLNELNADAKLIFNDRFCIIEDPASIHSDNSDAWDQRRADGFIKTISLFEHYIRMSEVYDDDDVEN